MGIKAIRDAIVVELTATELFKDVFPHLHKAYRRSPTAAIMFQGPSQEVRSTLDFEVFYFFELHIHVDSRHLDHAQEQVDEIVDAILARFRNNPTLSHTVDSLEVPAGPGTEFEVQESGAVRLRFVMNIVARVQEERD